MRDWKEELIMECIERQLERASIEQERAEDREIKNVESTLKKVTDALSTLEQPYIDEIANITTSIEAIHDQLITDWDITDKTYECGTGTATVRTTKALIIPDKKRLIATLLNIEKLPESIRSWNLSYLRKLKDVGLIEDNEAYFEEHQNVVIKGASDK